MDNPVTYKSKKISIILPVFNAELTIERCINSILMQTVKDWTLEVIDDGSTDGTDKILKKFSDKFENIYIHNLGKNFGLAYALNYGLRLAKGGFIARMDADDEMLPNRLQLQLDAFGADSTLDVCGMSSIIGQKTVSLNFLSHKEIVASLFFSNPIVHPTVMFKLSENLNIEYKNVVCEDYELWTSLALQGAIFENLSAPGLIYHRSSNQKSMQESHLVSGEAILIAERYTDCKNPPFKERLININYTFEKVNYQKLKQEIFLFKDKPIFDISNVDNYYFKRLIKRSLGSFKNITFILLFLMSNPSYFLILVKPNYFKLKNIH